MKRLAAVVFVGVLILGNVTVGYAQAAALGVVGGINVATLSEDEDINIDPRTGLRAGAHLSVDLSPQFGVILEAIYSQKGAKATQQGVDVGVNLTYMEFPLLAKFMIPTNEAGNVAVHLAAGPTVGFETSCKVKLEQGGTSVSVDCDDIDADTKSVDFGVAVLGGIEVEVGPGAVIFDVAYNLGLANIDDTAGDGSTKNRNLYFQAGYKFELGAKR